MNSAMNAYKTTSKSEYTQLGDVIMIYEHILDCLRVAQRSEPLDLYTNNIVDAMDNVYTLMFAIDVTQGEISENLLSLYQYTNRVLVESIDMDYEHRNCKIEEVCSILSELLSAWVEIK